MPHTFVRKADGQTLSASEFNTWMPPLENWRGAWDYLLVTNAGTYIAYDRGGATAASAADTGTTSGLKAVVEAIATDGVHIHFAGGTFSLLDAPLGSEGWANTETKLSFVDVRGVTISGEGMGRTTLTSFTNTPAASPDAATMLFTRCHAWHIHDLTIDQCGAYLSTMEALNINQATRFLVERVRCRRSKSDALIFDGGDAGRWSGESIFRDCIVQGRPVRPQCTAISGGTLTASTEYRYCVTWVDRDLAGVGTSGETKPSDWTSITTTTTNKTNRVTLDIGAASTTARKVYRWDAVNGWKLVRTQSDNTALTWDDDGSATPGTATFTTRSTVPGGGIVLLSSSDNLVTGCLVDGTGDGVVGATQYGIDLGQKGSVRSDRNRVVANHVAASYGHAYRVIGGSGNLFHDNVARNPGVPGATRQGFRIEGKTAFATNRNSLMGNLAIDDRDASSTDGGAGMQYGYAVTATNTPTDNVIAYNVAHGFTLAALSDLGTTTRGIGTNVGE